MRPFLYTVSIPHYNSPKTLERMLRSIPEREDIQVIVVDDGSNRESVEKLKMFRHKNLEMIFLDNNKGGGYARNMGLQHATGKWLISVDADDFFSDDAFDVFDQYKDSNYDYICYCITAVDENNLKPISRFVRSDKSVRNYIKRKNEKNLAYFKYRNYEPWNKMISMEFIRKNDIHWENCRINIDVMFGLQIGLKGSNFIAIPNELYNLVFTVNSITRFPRSIDREFSFYLQVMKRNTIYKRLGLGYPLYRPEFLYIPFLLKKRGIVDTIRFYKYRKDHIQEVRDAKVAYLSLLEEQEPFRCKNVISNDE